MQKVLDLSARSSTCYHHHAFGDIQIHVHTTMSIIDSRVCALFWTCIDTIVSAGPIHTCILFQRIYDDGPEHMHSQLVKNTAPKWCLKSEVPKGWPLHTIFVSVGSWVEVNALPRIPAQSLQTWYLEDSPFLSEWLIFSPWYDPIRNFKATTGRTFALIDSGLSEPQGLALDHDRGASLGCDGEMWRVGKWSDREGEGL